MVKINSVVHYTLRVKDVDRILAFYVDGFGFTEIFRLFRKDGSLWLIYLAITDNQFLEIYPNADADHAPGTFGNGLNHVCFAVDDAKAAMEELAKRGIGPSGDRKPYFDPYYKVGADNNPRFWVEDPEGNRIGQPQPAVQGCRKGTRRRRAGTHQDLDLKRTHPQAPSSAGEEMPFWVDFLSDEAQFLG